MAVCAAAAKQVRRAAARRIDERAHQRGRSIMRGGVVQFYMTVGSIFGVVLAGPLWYVALFDEPLPDDMPEIKQLLLVLLIATLKGVLRAFTWLPSLIYHVGMQKMGFSTWLFGGWW